MRGYYSQSAFKFDFPAYHTSFIKDLFLLSLLLILFLGFFLGSRSLDVPDEVRYSEIAREMIQNQDYITPTVNQVKFFDKPPLFYWCEVIVIKLFGLGEWSLRLVPAMFALLGCLFLYGITRMMFDPLTGWISAIILGISPLYYSSAHYINLDMGICFFITASLLCFWCALNRSQNTKKVKNTSLIFGYIFSAFAVLTKGLIGILFPTVIIGLWILLTKQYQAIRQLKIFLGITIILAITLPWFVTVQLKNPEFFNYFFVYQHFERFLKSGFNNPMPFWFYFPVFFIGFFPWSSFFLQSLYSIFKEFKDKLDKSSLFLLIWFFSIGIFFSIPQSKILSYILPVFPPAAILTARFFVQHWHSKPDNKSTYGFLLIIFISIVLAIGLFVFHQNTLFTANLGESNHYIWLIFILLISPYLIYKIFLRYGFSKAFSKLCIFIGLILLILLSSVPNYVKKTIKPLVLTLKPMVDRSDEIISYYEFFYELPFYFHKKITVVDSWDMKKLSGDNYRRQFLLASQFQDTRAWLIDSQEFIKRWKSPERKWVYTTEAYSPKLLRELDNNHLKYFQVGKYQNVIVFSNQEIHNS